MLVRCFLLFIMTIVCMAAHAQLAKGKVADERNWLPRIGTTLRVSPSKPSGAACRQGVFCFERLNEIRTGLRFFSMRLQYTLESDCLADKDNAAITKEYVF